MANGKYQQWLEPEGLTLLEGWARDGLTDEQLSKNMGIGTTTLYRWKEEYREIREALKRGKEVVDIQVENALLKRALGYEYTEETRELVKDKETGEYSLSVTKIVTKEVAPDVTAQIFWLKNRKPKKWRSDPQESGNEKQVQDHNALVDAIKNMK